MTCPMNTGKQSILMNLKAPCKNNCNDVQGRGLLLASGELLAGEADGKAIYDLKRRRLFMPICCKACVQCH